MSLPPGPLTNSSDCYRSAITTSRACDGVRGGDGRSCELKISGLRGPFVQLVASTLKSAVESRGKTKRISTYRSGEGQENAWAAT